MGYYSCFLLVNRLTKPRAESPVSYEFSLLWLCVQVFQLRIYYCIFYVIYNDEAEALLHQLGRHTWLENGLVIDSNFLPPYLLLSLVLQCNVITRMEEGRKWKRYSKRFQSVNKVYQLPLVSPSVYVASPFFFVLFFFIYSNRKRISGVRLSFRLW